MSSKPYQHSYLDDGLEVDFRALETGGWFIDKLGWKGCWVVGAGARHSCAGWEVNLNGR